ncbi:MAG: hypothetical protein HOF83_08615 [Pelagibacteraceae bacterium]|nr:hypothetical protein [Pelagibacteraceae bacterium]
MKKIIGKLALAVSFLTIVWLVLGMIMLGIYDVDLLVFKIPGTTEIRSHATLAVIFLLVASWAFWKED